MRSFASVCAAFSIAVGAAVLAGWYFGIEPLKSVLPGFVTMKANAAFAFVLAGASLLLLAPRSVTPGRALLGRLLALAVSLIGALTLGEVVFGWQLGIAELLIRDIDATLVFTSAPGRMAVSASIAFFLCGLALLVINWTPTRSLRPAELLALLVLAISSIAAIEHAFARSIVHPFVGSTRMAVHAAVAFFVLGAGLLAARPDRGIVGAIRVRMASALERGVYFSLAVSLFALLITGTTAFFAAQDSTARSERVERTHGVRRQLVLVLSTHQDLQIGSRGYVITGNPEFLQPFQIAREEADLEFRNLTTLVRDNPMQAARLGPLDDLRRKHIAWTEQLVVFGRNRFAAAAAQMVISGEGERRMDALREAIARMDAQESRLLRERTEEEAASVARLNGTLVASTLLALFVLAFAGVVIHRDFGRRQRAEQTIREQNELLEERVRERTARLSESEERLRQTLSRAEALLEHLSLLDHITRATGERQDLKSIFQVVVRSLEDSLPVDFGCVCLYDPAASVLTVSSVGAKSEALAHELAMDEQATIDVETNGLSRCVRGELVYEPDIGQSEFPFPRRLARTGLRSVVMAPLGSESRVFGVLVVARGLANAFDSVECEFLRQLSEHVALAAQQAQLYGSLQEAYDELRETQAAAMQEERLRALGQMASGIAHDINNTLSPVSLYAESLLETEKNLSERARGYLETIQRAVDDVAATVARMREFYRQREEQLEFVPVDVNRMVQQVLDLTRVRWSDMPQRHGISIQVRTELAAGLPQIQGVESEIREALVNLVFNAVDAMTEGGTLTLRTRLHGEREQTAVAIEVIDEGIGMDEETRQRCLEPFFTTKGERGTGLGLAMVFGTVQRHSADLEIDSTPGAGSTMRLVFAVQTAAAADPGQPAAAPEAPKRLRLLLVDDDPLLLKSLRDALEIDGHVVVTANGGEAGIAEFRAALERGVHFAAVITDLGMPYVDGRKVAAVVKEASPETPVILLTGWGRRLVAEGEIPAYVDRVLSKPPKLRELREALAQLCRPRPEGPSA